MIHLSQNLTASLLVNINKPPSILEQLKQHYSESIAHRLNNLRGDLKGYLQGHRNELRDLDGIYKPEELQD